MVVLLVALLALAATPGLAAAQDDRGYAGGGFMVSMQSPQNLNGPPSFPRSGIGGTAAGAAGEIGGFLLPVLSLSLEVSVPARFRGVQETHYFDLFRTESRHRDWIISGLLHVHGPTMGRVRPALVVGPSFVREDTLERTAHQVGPRVPVTGIFGPFGPEWQSTRRTFGMTAGLDYSIRANRRLQIVPQLRMHWIRRPEPDLRGLASLVIRPATGFRVSF